jgi:hypothetical protein
MFLEEYMTRSPAQFFHPTVVLKDLRSHFFSFALALSSCINPLPAIPDANTSNNFLTETTIRCTDYHNSGYCRVLGQYQFNLNNFEPLYCQIKCYS